MIIWQAHRALAAMLGDPVPGISSVTIPDGVRYSRAMRDEYMYRGILHFLQKSLEAVKNAPPDIVTGVLQGMYPNFMRQVTYAYAGNNPYNFPLTTAYGGTIGTLSTVPLYIYSLRLMWTSPAASQPVPVYSTKRASQVTSRKLSPNHFHDTIAEMNSFQGVTRMIIHPSVNDTTIAASNVQMEFLPMPTHPNLQLPTASIDFEAVYMDQILRRCAAYAALDSQDIGDVTTSLQMLLQ